MTVTEICAFASQRLLNRASTYIAASTEGLDWVNEWQEENAVSIKKFDTQTLTGCVAGTWYDILIMPVFFHKDFLVKIYEVRDVNGDLVYDYRADLGQIAFNYNGTYTITYYAIPTAVTAVGDTPDCHALFYKVIAYWLAYKKVCNGDPARPDGLPWRALYEEKMSSVLRSLQKRNRRVVIPSWR